MEGSGVIFITLGGKQERLWFNNFAAEELRRYLTNGEEVLTNVDLFKRIKERWEANNLVLLKNIVYAGIAGDSYVRDDVPRYTKEEVGALVATADSETLYSVWRVFLEAQGYNLTPDETSSEEGGEAKPPKEETDLEKKSQGSSN